MAENESKSQPLSFKEKLKTINFGTVPGGYRDLNRGYDKEAVEQMDWPSKEEFEDYRSDYRNAPTKEVSVESLPKDES